ncbi:beta-N-acetylhexosaminidase [Streptomyces iconiensis]|uniref:beta-N-acetylhexosaminidase n=1 Tax=Streptomyces iconiensis TaxID=1384038 RepID=A0ABT7A410_9ACTN|nr:beta-N-acetylhexosaminidase [Streptomyces iconiensis]MDJ1136082.1 beta-N-acetylhexosaminidase [Streptomyces iconiensis]
MSWSGLVPRPEGVREREGTPFAWGSGTALVAGPGTEGVARWLRAQAALPFEDPVPGTGGGAGQARGRNAVELRIDGELDEEGYRLTVETERVLIEGGSAAGVFWGAQTLRQALPPEAFRSVGTVREWHVRPARVEDAPRFAWRGLMLDVARHFTPKDGVLRMIDLMAAHKLNVLHFHLTDDQGWRVEIRRYPELTGTGAWRPRTRVGHRASPLWDERPHGGYYTQDDLREIVAYAAERHITVVPEIELPGHSQAAIAAYPELGNTDVLDTSSLGVWTDWGVSPHLLTPTDDTLRFYEHVLEEVLDLFPSTFVHIGGDETPKEEWRESAVAQARIAAEGLADEDALQAWMVRHFDRWLAARGRRMIGWDEILEGGTLKDGLTSGAAVSSWRGDKGGVTAATAGHDVVMCPEHQLYLDRRQAPGEDEPVPLGHVSTLRDVHEFEPLPPGLAGTPHARHVMGIQANMWTECTESAQRVDYQVFPRLAALAEVAWSPSRGGGSGGSGEPGEGDAFSDFERRMNEAHYARLDALGVNYRRPDGPRPWERRPGIPGRPLEPDGA